MTAHGRKAAVHFARPGADAGARLGGERPPASADDADPALRRLFLDGALPGFIFDRETLAILEANGAAAQRLGWPGGALVGTPVSDLCPDLVARMRRSWRAEPSPGPFSAAWTSRRQDGTRAALQVTLFAAAFGGRACAIALFADAPATARPDRRTNDAADQLQLRSEQLLEACRLAKITTWELSASACATGLAALDSAVDAAIRPIHADDRGIVRTAIATCIATQTPFDIELRSPLSGKRFAFYRIVGRCQTDAGGAVAKLTGVCQDITDRKEAETTILQAEKLKSIGELTGGIAHDFNNLLTVISMNLEMLLGSVASAEPRELLELIEPALQAVSSGAKLTAHLLAFAQRQPLRPKVVQLDAFLASLRELAVRTIGAHCTVELTCPADVWRCLVDRAQLESALLNLLVNARDAMPAGGRILIEASNVTLSAAADGLKPGDYVTLSVTDEGVGISPDIMDRVFEPFFTTKPVGKGTGLGLSMVLGFARQSNGRAEIASKAGRGTRVSLHLPRAEANVVPDADRAAALPADWSPLPFQTLVVDDTPEVLRAMTRMCREVGLRAMAADSAERAMALLNSGVPFDLLLTDVILPGRLGGAELAVEAARAMPAIRTLFTSGYTETDIVNRAKLGPGAELLVKPFTRWQLLEALQRVTGARASV